MILEETRKAKQAAAVAAGIALLTTGNVVDDGKGSNSSSGNGKNNHKQGQNRNNNKGKNNGGKGRGRGGHN